MSEVVRTPAESGELIELSGGARKRYRKRVLPIGEITYEGRKIKFDKAYLDQVKAAFDDRAYDVVPTQLADAQNRHTEDVERCGGEVTGLSVEDDGLWAEVELTERGSKVLQDNPKVSVSASLRNNYTRADGKHYPASMAHLLITANPRLVGLGEWTEVALSGYDDSDTVIDLTNSSYEGVSAVANGNDEKGTGAPLVSEDDKIRAALKLLDFSDEEMAEIMADVNDETDAAAVSTDKAENATDGAESDNDASAEAGDQEEPPGDAEGDRELVGAGASAELSNDSEKTETLDLANDDLRTRLAAAEAQLAESRFANEKAQWTAKGVPPAFVDLAAPILKATHGNIIDLSNAPGEDNKVDVADVMRKMIDKLAGFVTVAEERGHFNLANEASETDNKGDELKNVWDAISERANPKS